MAEEAEKRKIFNLTTVAKSIQKTIATRYTQAYWIKAELNKLNYYQHSGHCYPELVEKKEGRIVAQIRSTLWKNDYQRINKSFIDLLREPLKDGIKVLIYATIEFHPEYGLSLHILDIDPSFTLGDLEKEKQESIRRLKEENIFNQNKKLPFPMLPQRVAVISVQTSKGYADFLNVLADATTTNNYAFFQMLFPSLLQGDQAVYSLRKQLYRIKKIAHHFDIVVIVRGGGGEIGLTCYNNYELARDIALFPIPVLTGIGHSTNLTVAEMVAHRNTITPTGLAEGLVRKFDEFARPVEEGRKQILTLAQTQLKTSQQALQTEIRHFKTHTHYTLSSAKKSLNQQGESLSRAFRYLFREQYYRLDQINEAVIRQSNGFYQKQHTNLNTLGRQIRRDVRGQLQQNRITLNYHADNLAKAAADSLKSEGVLLRSLRRNIEIMDPKNVLKRGYSISLVNGKALTKVDQVSPGDTVEIELYEGSVLTKVETTSKNKENE